MLGCSNSSYLARQSHILPPSPKLLQNVGVTKKQKPGQDQRQQKGQFLIVGRFLHRGRNHGVPGQTGKQIPDIRKLLRTKQTTKGQEVVREKSSFPFLTVGGLTVNNHPTGDYTTNKRFQEQASLPCTHIPSAIVMAFLLIMQPLHN